MNDDEEPLVDEHIGTVKGLPRDGTGHSLRIEHANNAPGTILCRLNIGPHDVGRGHDETRKGFEFVGTDGAQIAVGPPRRSSDNGRVVELSPDEYTIRRPSSTIGRPIGHRTVALLDGRCPFLHHLTPSIRPERVEFRGPPGDAPQIAWTSHGFGLTLSRVFAIDRNVSGGSNVHAFRDVHAIEIAGDVEVKPAFGGQYREVVDHAMILVSLVSCQRIDWFDIRTSNFLTSQVGFRHRKSRLNSNPMGPYRPKLLDDGQVADGLQTLSDRLSAAQSGQHAAIVRAIEALAVADKLAPADAFLVTVAGLEGVIRSVRQETASATGESWRRAAQIAVGKCIKSLESDNTVPAGTSARAEPRIGNLFYESLPESIARALDHAHVEIERVWGGGSRDAAKDRIVKACKIRNQIVHSPSAPPIDEIFPNLARIRCTIELLVLAMLGWNTARVSQQYERDMRRWQ